MALGDLTTLTPAEARTAAEAAKAAVRNGKDPAAERKAAIEAERLARLRQVTVAAAADQYKDASLSGGTLHHEREPTALADTPHLFLFHRRALRHELLNVVVHAEDQQRGGRAEHRAGDAMVPVPAAVVVLDAH